MVKRIMFWVGPGHLSDPALVGDGPVGPPRRGRREARGGGWVLGAGHIGRIWLSRIWHSLSLSLIFLSLIFLNRQDGSSGRSFKRRRAPGETHYHRKHGRRVP